MRPKFRDQILKEHNIKLESISAFTRVSVLALKEIPTTNASIEGGLIVYRDYVDFSVAISTPEGLFTLVLRNAQETGFLNIEKGIADSARRRAMAN